jgi:hypothetical protein
MREFALEPVRARHKCGQLCAAQVSGPGATSPAGDLFAPIGIERPNRMNPPGISVFLFVWERKGVSVQQATRAGVERKSEVIGWWMTL